MKKITGILLVSLVFTVGCTTTQKSASVGTVAGAALGGIIGHQSGKGGEGAAIGAAAGALGGYILGDKVISTKNFCPTCGVQYDQSVMFCPKDGTELKGVEK